jgi:hypothetical protein
VEADDLVGTQRLLADLRDRQRRRVRGENRVAGGDRVELGEDLLLEADDLRHRLDDEVDVAEALVAGRSDDPVEDLLDRGLALLLGQLALVDELADLALGHVAGLYEAGVDELLLDVLEDDGDPRGGDRLGDLAAHRPRADDRSFEYVHASLPIKLAAAGYRVLRYSQNLAPTSCETRSEDRFGCALRC